MSKESVSFGGSALLPAARISAILCMMRRAIRSAQTGPSAWPGAVSSLLLWCGALHNSNNGCVPAVAWIAEHYLEPALAGLERTKGKTTAKKTTATAAGA